MWKTGNVYFEHFCETNNLKNLTKKLTSFKIIDNLSNTYLIVTNH